MLIKSLVPTVCNHKIVSTNCRPTTRTPDGSAKKPLTVPQQGSFNTLLFSHFLNEFSFHLRSKKQHCHKFLDREIDLTYMDISDNPVSNKQCPKNFMICCLQSKGERTVNMTSCVKCVFHIFKNSSILK